MPDGQPATMCDLYRPAGSLSRGPWSLEITQAEACWSWSSLRVLTLAPGGSHTFETADEEVLVLPLAGSCVLSCAGAEHELKGRVSVFEGPTDFCYAPPGSAVQVVSQVGGRFAVPGARAWLATGLSLPAGRRSASRSPRGRELLEEDRQLLHAGNVRGRPVDDLRSPDPGGELVVVPAA